MTRVDGRTVLITGGASGLGRLLAQRFGRLGGELVLWDVDEEGLKESAALIRDEVGREPTTVPVDLTDNDSIDRATTQTRETAGDPHVLVNNAGVAHGERFVELSDRQIETTMRVNATAVMLVTRRFLPAMIEQGAGHVVTIASASGVTGVARLSAYAASKHAAVGFSDSLRQELRGMAPGVRTTLVCPYYLNTGMFAGAKTRFSWLLPILDADDVADRIVRCVLRNRQRLSMPWLIKAVPALRTLPPKVTDPVADFLGVNVSLEEFIGRPGTASRVE